MPIGYQDIFETTGFPSFSKTLAYSVQCQLNANWYYGLEIRIVTKRNPETQNPHRRHKLHGPFGHHRRPPPRHVLNHISRRLRHPRHPRNHKRIQLHSLPRRPDNPSRNHSRASPAKGSKPLTPSITIYLNFRSSQHPLPLPALQEPISPDCHRDGRISLSLPNPLEFLFTSKSRHFILKVSMPSAQLFEFEHIPHT